MKAVILVLLALVCAPAQSHNHDGDRSNRHERRDDFDSRWERTQRKQERERRTNSDRLCEGQSSGCRDNWSYR